MRHVDKRRWICANIIGNCSLSRLMLSAMYLEVPADKKCPLCQSDITIFPETPETATQGIVEVVPEWQCRSCKKTGSLLESGGAPEKCPDCGGEVLTPLLKKDGPFDPSLDLLKKY